jgi:hypothetical protein
VVPTDILIRPIGYRNVEPPSRCCSSAEDTTNCIHFAFLAEGYTPPEMDVFSPTPAQRWTLSSPMSLTGACAANFNIVAVKSPSKDSGASEPGKGIWKNTALGSHWDTNYSERYLTTTHLKDMHDLLAGTPTSIFLCSSTPTAMAEAAFSTPIALHDAQPLVEAGGGT